MDTTTKFLREKGLLSAAASQFVIQGDFGVVTLNELLAEYHIQESTKQIEFTNTVQEMRDNQKQYFATKSKKALFASKNLEKKVDEYLK